MRKLQQQLKETKEELGNVKTELATANRELKEAKKDLAETKSDLETATGRVTALEEQLAFASNELEATKSTLVDIEASRRWADAFEADVAESAHEVDRPARIVCGSAEHADGRERAEQLAQVLGAHFVPVPHASHLLPLEHPDALASEVRALAGGA